MEADDALVKKNTDCVYFLASPLTCKKGNECEFRHSESARVNPRDCRYWLSGNCLNWDCAFRHPPLEGRATNAATAASGPGAAGKSRVPCYYFSQGYCAKGDKCPYMHGTPSVPNLRTPSVQRPVKVSTVSAPEANEKPRDVPPSNGVEAKSVRAPLLGTNLPAEVRPVPVAVVLSNQKDGRTVSGATQNGAPRVRAEGPVVNSGVVASRPRLRQVQPGDDRVQHGMEQDEWWEESSPGFDVLVDDGPDPPRYPDDPEFQSAGETGLDSEKVAGGNRGRGGRSMRMGDDIDQYDYDYGNVYDHPSSYEGGARYDDGSYEYNLHDQQGGYDLSSAYDRTGQHRSSAYSDRVSADEMLARERLGLPMDVDMRSGGGAQDQRSRIVKRRRGDSGQQHVPESHSRRQRTDMPVEDYQHQRQQEDQQKQHELHLRHQLFLQHGMRNSSRRGHEKTGLEPGVIARRALHDLSAAEGGAPGSDRVPLKNAAKGRPNDHARSGVKDVDIHSRLSKAVDTYGEAETRTYMDVDGSRKVDKDTKKEPSAFAGPKSLAQIRAEKRKGAVEVPPKTGEVLNGLRATVQSNSQPKGLALRSQVRSQVPSVPTPNVDSLEALSVGERKIKREKVVTQDSKKVSSFEGPKSLSAILREKRKVESGTDSRMEDSNSPHLQRLSPPTSRVVVPSRVDNFPGVGVNIPVVDTEVGAKTGYADVEDGEFLSEDDEIRKGRTGEHREERRSHFLATEIDGSQSVGRRASLPEVAVLSPQLDEPGQGSDKVGIVEEEINGAGAARNGEDFDYTEGQEYEGENKEEDVEPEHDEDGYGLDDDDDDEEDDFAKKLGGFFQ